MEATESSLVGDNLSSTYALVYVKIDDIKRMIQNENNVSDRSKIMISEHLDTINQKLKSTTQILENPEP